ncbi:hypothetical protein Pint_36451 [Pistacia integerrima]|uniref:Uncharacterized protein n=1 Tax=Pistacia integerrima TaxID=434235 RepID=A0ACC0Y0D8_9ROSI|nr:hypothetical protein Pint_36451 [Pistacia integerrima]
MNSQNINFQDRFRQKQAMNSDCNIEFANYSTSYFASQPSLEPQNQSRAGPGWSFRAAKPQPCKILPVPSLAGSSLRLQLFMQPNGSWGFLSMILSQETILFVTQTFLHINLPGENFSGAVSSQEPGENIELRNALQFDAEISELLWKSSSQQ